eukprot:12303534-Alexandrium_andersonii.AAC.1
MVSCGRRASTVLSLEALVFQVVRVAVSYKAPAGPDGRKSCLGSRPFAVQVHCVPARGLPRGRGAARVRARACECARVLVRA